MKILVVDDNFLNLGCANSQFRKEHDQWAACSFDEAISTLQDKDFDVVMVDLLMPPSGHKLAEPAKFTDQEMPVGIFLALLAAKNGAKYVAVFTDSDHHSHPASTCFDLFNPKGESKPEPMELNGAKLFLCNNRQWVRDYAPWNYDKPLSTSERSGVEYVHRVKDWKSLLEYMLAYK